MTNKTDFTFLSSDGKTRLHGIAWVPEDTTPTAVLQIVHGVAEHIGRYDDFARFLNGHGVVVVGHDHLGHGGSLPEGGTPVYFGHGNTWQTPVDDIYVLHTKLKERYPGLPLLLMGHSMGSFLSRTYLIRYSGTVKAAILMGTGWQSGAALTGGLALSGALARRDPAATNATVNALAFGAYNKMFKPNRTGFDWLSADPENVDDYMADPLCGHDATVGLFHEMLRGIRFNQRPANLRKMDMDTPVLLISGQDDPVGAMGAGVRRTYQEFRRAGVKDCTLKLYPALRHELLNEKEHRPAVYQNIWSWMEEKLK